MMQLHQSLVMPLYSYAMAWARMLPTLPLPLPPTVAVAVAAEPTL
jgi:hypothetical protein